MLAHPSSVIPLDRRPTAPPAPAWMRLAAGLAGLALLFAAFGWMARSL
jgi:hypothetical protein